MDQKQDAEETWRLSFIQVVIYEISLRETRIIFFDIRNCRSGEATDGLYPTVTIRQIMWALKMKPIPRERWETCFDRRNI